jgi:hypothetical protein
MLVNWTCIVDPIQQSKCTIRRENLGYHIALDDVIDAEVRTYEFYSSAVCGPRCGGLQMLLFRTSQRTRRSSVTPLRPAPCPPAGHLRNAAVPRSTTAVTLSLRSNSFSGRNSRAQMLLRML